MMNKTHERKHKGMWKDISPVWQAAFEEMWESFCAGSTPIGAVLCNESGEIVLRDHNRNAETQTLNKKIAHAEANLLKRLDTLKYEPRSMTLYSTMEPCPMCMGTILMSSIKKVRYAAADKYCGMTHLLKIDSYYTGKGVDCAYEAGDLEYVQLTVQSYFELRCIEQGCSDKVFVKFAGHCPPAVELARTLYETKWLDEMASKGTSMGDVFDHILRKIEKSGIV